MAKERLYLFDTTLRDGAQTNGVDFTLADKLAIANMLDGLGIDYVEGGYPGANPADTELFAKDRDLKTTFTAFGMTRRPGRSASNDPGLAALLDAHADAICFVAKAWDYHVKVALETTNEENLASIRDSVKRRQNKGQAKCCSTASISSTATRPIPITRWPAPRLLMTKARAGWSYATPMAARCRTKSSRSSAKSARSFPATMSASTPITTPSRRWPIPSPRYAPAPARSRARSTAWESAAATPISVSLIPTLKLKKEFSERFDIAVSDAALKQLTHVSHALDERLNRAPDRHAPYVGTSAFATKAGIHASAIMKDPATYEHVKPETVGNKRKVLVSEQAGRSNVLAELERIGLKVDKNDARIGRLLEIVKEREGIGYAYEAADASFELLARRTLGTVPNYFDVTQFDVNVEQRNNAKGERVTVTMAVVKVRVGADNMISAAEGNGPVNALDLALRKDLGKYQKYIDGLKLTDYRVRILNSGSEAVTRVLIESEDEAGEHWTTIGISPNIIDASFQALMDSIVYKLVKSGAPA